jgi:hypothetical protein
VKDRPSLEELRNLLAEPALVDNVARVGLGGALAVIAYERRHEIHRRVYRINRWIADRLPGDNVTSPSMRDVLAYVVGGLLLSPAAYALIKGSGKHSSTAEVDAAEAAYLDALGSFEDKLQNWNESMEFQLAQKDRAEVELARAYERLGKAQEAAFAAWEANIISAQDAWQRVRDEIDKQRARLNGDPVHDAVIREAIAYLERQEKAAWSAVMSARAAPLMSDEITKESGFIANLIDDIHARTLDIRTLEGNKPVMPPPPAWWVASPSDALLYAAVAFMIGTHPEILPQAVSAIGSVLRGLGEIIPL